MKESLIAKRSFVFALQVIRLCQALHKTHENVILLKQIIRSSTSIGANVEEALGANSKKEFVHSMNVSKKEARETFYWLRLLVELNVDQKTEIGRLMQENKELLNILTSIVKSSSIS